MTNSDNVLLERTFTLLEKGEEAGDGAEAWSRFFSRSGAPTWPILEAHWRAVVLAEAGAGKTHELRHRAAIRVRQGEYAFFIRIEDIEERFEHGMDVGSFDIFGQWIAGSDEAWFYLDSVDEARLGSAQAFERAIKAFAHRIKDGKARAHVIISSRPYAWRTSSDRALIDQHLPDPAAGADGEAGVKVYRLNALGADDVRTFASARGVANVDGLLTEIERRSLWFMAGHPFDLKLLLGKWRRDSALGTRLQLLEEFIDALLMEQNNPAHARRHPLTLSRARAGAGLLAAALVLGNESAIVVPDEEDGTGIDPRSALGAEWRQDEIRALLECGVFGDILYGQVRFRHREMRELLAAKFLFACLGQNAARRNIEQMIFRETYGVQFVAPRMRPILPWMMLFDERIRSRALMISPDLAMEGGDPASLPLPVRQRILEQTVAHIASDTDDQGARDNAAIGRIARADLAETALALIQAHSENDDAVFFLGRLVWQGEIAICVPALAPIGVSPGRGIHARIAAVRAVMTCGIQAQQASLWDGLNANPTPFPRRLLSEIAQHAEPSVANVERLIASLALLEPYERFKVDSIDDDLHAFTGRLPVPPTSDPTSATAKLLAGLHRLLTAPPFIERRHCEVSKDNAWLMTAALGLIERLIKTRSQLALAPEALDILTAYPAIAFWHEHDLKTTAASLSELIYEWPDLNDCLFWHHAGWWRARSDEPLIDVWHLQVPDHLWRFQGGDISRVIQWAKPGETHDNRQLATSLCAVLCIQADRPPDLISQVQAAVADDESLLAQLADRLAPPPDPGQDLMSAERSAWRRSRDEREAVEAAARADWIRSLQADPSRVRPPAELGPAVLTNTLWWLFSTVREAANINSRWAQPDWKMLVDEFGTPVAESFRDAAMNFWRQFHAPLGSEGDEEDGTNGRLIFALTGLEIEAAEKPSFPRHLSETEVSTALRCATKELNGFPAWLESMFRAHPRETIDSLMAEIRHEWRTSDAAQRSSVLSRIDYAAPYLHRELVEPLLGMMEAHAAPNHHQLASAIRVAKSGEADVRALGSLAAECLRADLPTETAAVWYALWVDCAPHDAVPAMRSWLNSMPRATGTDAASYFILALLGDRSDGSLGPTIGEFQRTEHLLALYKLMHAHIRAEDDIDRSDGGAYSVTHRDEAQRGRDTLLHLLNQCSGKATYLALKSLADEAADARASAWLARMARNRARADGDIEAVSPVQLADLARVGTMVPSTHRQLFDATSSGLEEVRQWLEHGHDSPARTWARAEDENEMRVLISHALGQHVRARATVGQEHEMATGDRPDIWMQTPDGVPPVPVELKLLDKAHWTGPILCDRMLNQLAGRYLRDHQASCGVFLLVWQGRRAATRQWVIDGERVDPRGLEAALTRYWSLHSDHFPGVENLLVMVIDLTVRTRG